MTALLIDFGSTFTKVRAIALDPPCLLASGQAPSTVRTDIGIGLHSALADLRHDLGELPEFAYRLACSSAAGGLRMVTSGLMPDYTAEVAKRAALGAGAKVVGSFAHHLTCSDIKETLELAPDIFLLAGGTDGGNSDVILDNARALSESAITCPIVVAGNRDVADDVRDCLTGADKIVIVTANVMPEFGEINIEPARAAIREVFIDRIVHAKGIDRAADLVDRVVMPTPAAVLEAARIIANGYNDEPGFGELVMIDVGGATTDVYSVASGEPTEGSVVRRGLPESFAKRTVEGDLGVRHNVRSIAENIGIANIASDAGVEPKQAQTIVESFEQNAESVPTTRAEWLVNATIARHCAHVATTRHAGSLEIMHTFTGPVPVQHGKDLRTVNVLIGTGGGIVHGREHKFILDGAVADSCQPLQLRPSQPRLLIDGDHLLYAVGLLSVLEPQAAFRLARSHLVEVPRG